MYFAFLGYYTMFLGPPALLSLFCHLPNLGLFESVHFVPLFSILNLVWVTIFFESWKRKCATLAYSWGTIDMALFEETRAAYHGELRPNPVTDRLEPYYSKTKRLLQLYCVSVPVIGLGLLVTFLVMLAYFWMATIVQEYDRKTKTIFSEFLLLMPTIVYVLLIIIMNSAYRLLAVMLTNRGEICIGIFPLC